MTVQGRGSLNAGSASPDEVTVVLCALNEEQGIGEVIEGLRREGFRNIMVVDGYSTDGTVSIALNMGVRVIQQHWEGKSGAIKTALDYVDTPLVAFMDADSTYSPADLHKLLVHAHNYVEVIGKRNRNGVSTLHRLGNSVINKLFSLVFAADVGDVLSGMYLLRTDVAKQMSLNSKGFEVEVEIAAQALQRGKVTYVPISYGKRKGKAKLSTLRDGLKISYYVLKMAKEYNPVMFYSTVVTSLSVPGAALVAYTLAIYALHNVFHSGYALMGIALLLMGMQGIMALGIASLIKRVEYLITRKSG